MAKGTLTLANGTTVEIEGTAEEVHRLLVACYENRPVFLM